MPTNPTYIQSFVEITNDEDEWEHGGNGEDIVQSLEIGDNFVVDATLGNEEDCEFYVTYYEKLIFEVSADGLNNDWGNSFELGYIVIGGCYYQRWDYEQQNGTMYFVNLQDQGLVFLIFWASCSCIKFCYACGPSTCSMQYIVVLHVFTNYDAHLC
jgi:hypothetical protein